MKIQLSLLSLLLLTACSPPQPQVLTTIADARTSKALMTDLGITGDSTGDILVFDQPLLDAEMKVIGTNSGSCIRTRVAHSFQCQWTLSMEAGSIQVAGREHDQGSSEISIVGGTGSFTGIYGVMSSTNNGDGTFTQVLQYKIRN